jgi:hypothetical protein
MMPSRGDHRARQATHAAEHADGEHAADVLAPDRRFDRLDDDEEGSGERGRGDRDAEGDALDADRVGGEQPQRQLILGHRLDGATDEAVRQIELEAGDHQQGEHTGYQHAQGKIDDADSPARPDIRCLHIPVVDAKHQNQADFGDEQQAEKEGKAAQGLLSASLERKVVDLIDRHAQQVERRQRQTGDDDRVGARRDIQKIGDVGAEDDEGRVGDIDHVEHAK